MASLSAKLNTVPSKNCLQFAMENQHFDVQIVYCTNGLFSIALLNCLPEGSVQPSQDMYQTDGVWRGVAGEVFELRYEDLTQP